MNASNLLEFAMSLHVGVHFRCMGNEYFGPSPPSSPSCASIRSSASCCCSDLCSVFSRRLRLSCRTVKYECVIDAKNRLTEINDTMQTKTIATGRASMAVEVPLSTSGCPTDERK